MTKVTTSGVMPPYFHHAGLAKLKGRRLQKTTRKRESREPGTTEACSPQTEPSVPRESRSLITPQCTLKTPGSCTRVLPPYPHHTLGVSPPALQCLNREITPYPRQAELIFGHNCQGCHPGGSPHCCILSQHPPLPAATAGSTQLCPLPKERGAAGVRRQGRSRLSCRLPSPH